MKVDLFYLSPNPYGGWVTYTSHLMKAMRAVGIEPRLFKIRERSEAKTRPFGYNEVYQNITLETALASPNKKLIVAAAKNFKEETDGLWNAGAGLVVHDPTEIKNLPSDVGTERRVVVVRRAGLKILPHATFIPHPYIRRTSPDVVDRDRHAISVSRVDFDKHTDILLDANRLLPTDKRISIRGFENRIYTRFKIVPKYPEWKQSIGHFPREPDAAFNLLQQHRFSIDMSEIKGDGGGTQYTFLESWDAGCVLVINAAWMNGVVEKDDMQPEFNCRRVGDAEELARILANAEGRVLQSYFDSLVQGGYASLANHAPYRIGEQYKSFLGGL